MNLSEIISPQEVIPDLKSEDKLSVLAELIKPLAKLDPDLDEDNLIRILLEREKLGSTGIGDGIAIPHGKVDNLQRLLISFGRSGKGIEFDSMDGRPAHLFFLLLAPESSAGFHLTALAKLSRLLKNQSFRQSLKEAPDAEAIYNLIVAQDENG
ncbi:MAG: PTS sugar transporter subunit IIA [Deltaproteobacteria bacterium]|nr:PTS sugar transporter subunit IIA [Deltaproteobacteria bacterium]